MSLLQNIFGGSDAEPWCSVHREWHSECEADAPDHDALEAQTEWDQREQERKQGKRAHQQSARRVPEVPSDVPRNKKGYPSARAARSAANKARFEQEKLQRGGGYYLHVNDH